MLDLCTQLILAFALFYLFFQAVSLHLRLLVYCLNHIILSKHIHERGAACFSESQWVSL